MLSFLRVYNYNPFFCRWKCMLVCIIPWCNIVPYWDVMIFCLRWISDKMFRKFIFSNAAIMFFFFFTKNKQWKASSLTRREALQGQRVSFCCDILWMSWHYNSKKQMETKIMRALLNFSFGTQNKAETKITLLLKLTLCPLIFQSNITSYWKDMVENGVS